MDMDLRPDAPAKCTRCAAVADEPPARPRGGRLLRHWTTDDQVFMGKTTTTPSRTADWGLADARKLNLIASKLKSLTRRTRAL